MPVFRPEGPANEYRQPESDSYSQNNGGSYQSGPVGPQYETEIRYEPIQQGGPVGPSYETEFRYEQPLQQSDQYSPPVAPPEGNYNGNAQIEPIGQDGALGPIGYNGNNEPQYGNQGPKANEQQYGNDDDVKTGFFIQDLLRIRPVRPSYEPEGGNYDQPQQGPQNQYIPPVEPQNDYGEGGAIYGGGGQNDYGGAQNEYGNRQNDYGGGLVENGYNSPQNGPTENGYGGQQGQRGPQSNEAANDNRAVKEGLNIPEILRPLLEKPRDGGQQLPDNGGSDPEDLNVIHLIAGEKQGTVAVNSILPPPADDAAEQGDKEQYLAAASAAALAAEKDEGRHY